MSSTPLDGRLLVIVTPDYDGVYEPRLQANDGWVAWGPPFWGMDVNRMQPGVPVLFGGSGVDGPSLASLDDLKPGKYYVQALLNVYTTFHRSDGSVVKLHMPAGDGNNPFITPGNLVSTPVKLNLNPATDKTFALQLDQVLPPLEMVPPGGTTAAGQSGRHEARQAHQDQERVAVEVLGAADVHRRRRPAAGGLRRSRQPQTSATR